MSATNLPPEVWEAICRRCGKCCAEKVRIEGRIDVCGFDSEDVRPLGAIHPNPAIQANRCHTFVAYDARPCGEPAFDSTEETEVVLVPLADVPDRIRDGTITHALVVVAFHWLSLLR